VALADDIKKVFWEELDNVVQRVPQNEKLFLGGGFNGILDRRLMGMI